MLDLYAYELKTFGGFSMATEQTLDTILNANLKTIAETPAWATAQKEANDISHAGRLDKLIEFSMQNFLSHQNRNNMLAETYVGKQIENMTSVDPIEATATSKLFHGESDAAIASLLAQLSSGQIGAKTAMTTPPETGVTQLFAQLNALTQSGNQNSSSIQNMNQATNVAMLAIAQVLAKVAETTPPKTA